MNRLILLSIGILSSIGNASAFLGGDLGAAVIRDHRPAANPIEGTEEIIVDQGNPKCDSTNEGYADTL